MTAPRLREHNRPPSPPDRRPPRRGGHPSSKTASAAARPAGFARLRGPRGRVRYAGALAAAALLALSGALALPATAEAQTVTTLVSNLDTSGGSSTEVQTTEHAQQFTTGTGAAVSLSAVEVYSRQENTSSSNFGVSLWSSSASGAPRERLATFTNPSDITSLGVKTFTSPGPDALILQPMTSYLVVFSFRGTTGGPFTLGLSRTGETGLSGWTVADSRISRSTTSDLTAPWGVSTATPVGMRLLGIRLDVYVAGLGITSDPAEDNYVTGDVIQVTVTFNEAVTVDTASGTPRLALTVGSNTRYATYSASDSTATELVFAYPATADDHDQDGISVAANALDLDGGAIHKQGDTSTNAELAHGALSTQSGHRVNRSPSIVTDGVSVTSTPRAATDTYGAGETIEISVTFSEAVTATTDTDFVLSVSGRKRAPLRSGSGTETLVFGYIVEAGDSDTNGIWIGDQDRTLVGDRNGDPQNGAITGVATGRAAVLTHGQIGTLSDRKVDGTLTPPGGNTAPAITTTSPVETPENGTAVATLAATDAESDPITWSKTGGADTDRFALTTAGVLTFVAAPDYESPADVASADPANAAANNEYVVFVTASDGTDDTAIELVVRVTNADEGQSGTVSIDDTAPMVGDALTASTASVADPDGLPDSFAPTWQWYRTPAGGSETEISAATSATYTVVEDDLGAALTAKASWTDGGAFANTLASAPTSAVTARAGICERTVQVREAIVAAASGVSACANVTDAHLAAITELDLASTGISSLQADDFDGLTALGGLHLGQNSLSGLPAGVFDGLTALTDLRLDENSLSDLPAGVFDGLTALGGLHLGQNSLSGLPAGVFDDLTALTALTLGRNSLSNLPAGVFDDLTALMLLYLQNNSLSDLPAGVFENLTALRFLWLHSNPGTDDFVPTANAGGDQRVAQGAAVTLDGSASGGAWGTNVTYQWTKTSGAPVTLSGADTDSASFTAPSSAGDLVFTLTVTGKGRPGSSGGGIPYTDTDTATVRVAAASTDATLSGLAVSDDSTDLLTFVSGTTTYTATVANDVETVTFTATKNDDGASVAYLDSDGNPIDDADTTEDGFQVPLAEGANVITVRVTAEDGTTQDYTVTVTRAEALPTVTIAADHASFTAVLDQVTFTLTRTGDPAEGLDVSVALTQDKDLIGSANLAQTVTFRAGEATATLNIYSNLFQDSTVTGETTLTATVQAGSGYVPGSLATASTRIRVADPAVTASFEQAAYTFDEAAGDATVAVILRTATGVPVPHGDIFLSINSETIPGGASPGGVDFENPAGSIQVVPSDFTADGTTFTARKEVTLAIVDDALDEPDEALTVILEPLPSTQAVVALSQPDGTACPVVHRCDATVTITDNDESAVATLSGLAVSGGGADLLTFASDTTTYTAMVTNDVETLTFTPTKSDAGASVAYLDADGNAIDDADTTADGHQVPLDVGTNVITVRVTSEDGATTQDYTVTVTRAAPPTVTVAAAAGVETVAEGAAAAFTLSRTGSTTAALTVAVSVSETGAVLDDASAAPSSVTFDAGSATATLALATNDDDTDNDAGTVTVTLGAGTGYAVGDPGAATVEVTDNDVPVDFVLSVPATVAEDGGTVTVTVTATTAEDAPPATAVAVFLQRAAGTATSGSDYEAVSETAFFQVSDFAAVTVDGQPRYRAEWTHDVTILDDDVEEGDETVVLAISPGSGLQPIHTLAGGNAEVRATLTIVDDDAANAAPAFTSSQTFGAAENQTTVGAVQASDDDTGDDITGYALTGGADQALFAIGATGALTFQAAPDYENPQDTDTDNAYLVEVQATGGTGDRVQTATQAITVTVMDVDEQPEQPAKPTVTAVADSSTSLAVSWSEPGLNGGPAITGYGVQYREAPSGTWTDWTHGDDSTEATITGLMPDTDYQVQVRALNGETPSAWSDPSEAVSTNAAMTPVVTIAGDRSTGVINEDEGSAGFTLSRTGSTTAALAVTVEVTQEEDRDLLPDGAAAERTVTFAVNSATTTLMVTLEDDDLGEVPGTLTVEVQAGTGYTVGDPGSATVTVLDNDTGVPTPANLEASPGAGVGEVVLSWDAHAPYLAFVRHEYRYKTDGNYPGTWTNIPSSGLNTSGEADGSNLTGYTVTGLVGGQVHSFQVRTFRTGSTSAASNEAMATPRSAAVSFGAGSYSVNEGGTVDVAVRLNGAPGREVVVPVSAAGAGGAAAPGETGADWSGVPENVTFGATDTEQSFTLAATQDLVDDDGESVALSFGTLPDGVTAGSPAQATVTIVDDDAANVAPSFTSPTTFGVDENGTTVGTVQASDDDADDDITGYALSGGADQALFAIGATGALTFQTAPDYEHPQDADADNDYLVEVQATGGTGDRVQTETQTITVTVIDADEQPEQPAKPTVTAVSGTTDSLDVSWSEPGLNGGPEIKGYGVQYRVTGSGTWTNWSHSDTTTATTITGLTAGTEYEVQVRALNGETPSAWSDPSDALRTNALPTLSVADASAAEGSAVTFTVTLSAAAAANVTATWTASLETGDTASAADFTDLSAATGMVTVTAGQTAGTFTVATAPDTTDEDDDETFTLTLSTPSSNATLAADPTATGTITDDDALPALVIGHGSAPEDSAVEFTVSLTPASGRTVTAIWAVNLSGQTAELADFSGNSLQNGTVTFTPGQTTVQIQVAVVDDATDEPDETFVVNLAGATNARIEDNTATGTIEDDDDPPTISVQDQTVNEGDQNPDDLVESGFPLRVALSAASEKRVRYRVRRVELAGDTATNADLKDGNIYLGIHAMPAGETVEYGEAELILNDTLDEPDETFTVEIYGFENATAGAKTRSTITIEDDDDPPTVSVADAAATEGDPVEFAVTLSAVSGRTVTVDAATSIRSSDTAAAGDFTAVPATTLTFMPGEPAKTVTVQTTQDAADESNETFTLTLSSPSNVTLGDPTATGTIVDDDEPNVAPSFTSSSAFGPAENQTTVGTVEASDSDAGDAITGYAITGGADMGFFSIGATSGALTFDAAPDYENPQDADTGNTYEVTVQATSGTGDREQTTIQAITVTVRDDDTEAPDAPGAPNVSAASVTSLTVTWPAPDNDGPAITDYDYRYRMTSPAGTWVEVTTTTITALSATITGLAENTFYDVQVRATNAEGTGSWSASGSGATDANAAPAFTSSAMFDAAENQTAAGTVEASDDDTDDLVTGYAITGGADMGFFSIGATSGALTFQAPPDFEDPRDADAGNTYEVTVQATSGTGDRERTATQAITVTVRDDDTEAPDAPVAPSVSAVSVTSLNVTWPAPDNAGPAITDYDYRYRTTSPQGAWMEVTTTTITGLSATIGSLQENTSYDVQVRATNDEGTSGWSASGSGATDANAAPAFTSPATFGAAENQTAAGTVEASDSDGDDAVTGYAITGGADQGFFSIGATSGALTFQTAPDYENPQDADTDNAYLVEVQATGGTGDREQTETQTITVTVMNADEGQSGTVTRAAATPAAPTGFTAAVGNAQVGLFWDAPASGSGVTRHEFRQKTTGSYPATWKQIANSAPGGANQAGFKVTGLTNEVAHTFELRAANASGEGAAAQAGPVTPTPGICDRTQQVRDEILLRLSGVSDCAAVTVANLATITGTLDFTRDGLTSLQAGDFAGLTEMSGLDLTSNSLSSLPAGVFSGLRSLQNLNLPDNDLSLLPDGVFSGLTALKWVYLNDNELGSLPDGVFSGLTALRTLDLTSNSLSSLPAGVFSGLRSLQNLYLPDNGLSLLPDGVFSGLTALEWLYLHDNDLSLLPAGVFFGLTSLRTLDLGANPSLRPLPGDVFSELTKLRELHLSNTGLEMLPAEIFSGLTELRQLYLSGNRLTELPAGVFSGLSQLYELHLGSNSANPMPLAVTVEKVGTDQVRAKVLAGAPFTVDIPVTVANGALVGGAASLGVAAGSVESTSVTVTRTAGTTAAVTADVDLTTPPSLPERHGGYVFARASSGLPAEILPAVPTITDVANMEPAFTSSTTFGPAENQTTVGTVQASDSDTGDNITGYAITGGADQGFFSIGATSGALTFDAAPDYENPQDQDAGNTYEVTVQATSGTGDRELTETQAITVTVRDDDTEAPGAPDAPSVTAVSATSLSVTWSAPDNAGPEITDYDYRYRTSSPQGAWVEVADTTITGLSATIGSLQENTSYDVQVRATNDEGTGAWSASGSGTTVGPSSGGICDRTPRVRDRILVLLKYRHSYKGDCSGVKAEHLAKLTSLDLRRNPSTESAFTMGLRRNDFEGLLNLVELDLADTGLGSLPAGVFDGLASLETLNLNKNRLRSLPAGVFAGLGSLETLRLQQNPSLRSLPYDEFEALPALTLLRVDPAGRMQLQVAGGEGDAALEVAAGGSVTYPVRLMAAPDLRVTAANPVRIGVSSDTAGVVAAPATLRFTKENWFRRQTVTVRVLSSASGTAELAHEASGTTTDSQGQAQSNYDFEDYPLPKVTVRVLESDTSRSDDPLTAAFQGLPASHDGETAFSFRIAFSEAVSVTPEAMRTRVLTVAGGAVTGAARVDGESGVWAIEVTPDTREALSITLAPAADCEADGAVCTADGRALSVGAAHIVSGPGPETQTQEERALTASFEGLPAEHRGQGSFRFRVAFSEGINISYKTVRDASFTVTGGDVTGAGRVDGRRDLWKITVKPASDKAVTIRLPETSDCGASGAICTSDGRPLSHSLSATVSGPVGISVADARVEEGAGAVLAFAVTLSRAASAALTVDYATADGSAHAGDDYRAARGTLKFRAGESSQTIEVTVLDDAHDEGEETLALRLSNPSGGRLADGEATGTIANHDSMPRALLARFGRTAAVHVVEHVEERLAAPREPGFRGRFAGRELRRGMERDIALNFLRQLGGTAGAGPLGAGAGGPLSGAPAAGAATLGMPGPAGGGGHLAAVSGPMGGAMPRGGAPGAMGMASGPRGGAAGAMGMGAGPLGGGSGPDGGLDRGRLLRMGLGGGDVLTGSDFALGRETGHGGILSLWSRGAQSRFSGREGALSLGGDVRTTMFGADYAKGPLVTGLSLSHSRGLGEYAGVAGGQVASSVTGLYPWLGYQATERVTVWGVAGYGSGGLLLTPQGGPALESGLSMAMAAAGTRGELVSGGAGGFALAFKADALWVGTSIDGVDGAAGRMAATDTAVTRFRTGLEGSRAYTLAGRLSLRPSLEVGLRHDGGDAETGAGLDVGGGLVVSDASTGLAVDVRVRMLVMHQAEGFRERGVAVSLSYNPRPSTPLGFVARVAPSWGGQATSGAEALWGRETMAGMAHGSLAQGNQVDAEVGYGLPVGSRFVGTPTLGLRTSEYGRDYRLGYSLGVLNRERLAFELGVEAQRRESPMVGGTDSGVLGQATLGW